MVYSRSERKLEIKELMVRVETREIARSQISLVLVGSSENFSSYPKSKGKY